MTSDICSDPKSSSECVLTGCDVPQDQDDGWPAVGDGGKRNGASHPVPGFRPSKRVSRLGQTASKWCKRAYAVESLSAGAGRLSEIRAICNRRREESGIPLSNGLRSLAAAWNRGQPESRFNAGRSPLWPALFKCSDWLPSVPGAAAVEGVAKPRGRRRDTQFPGIHSVPALADETIERTLHETFGKGLSKQMQNGEVIGEGMKRDSRRRHLPEEMGMCEQCIGTPQAQILISSYLPRHTMLGGLKFWCHHCSPHTFPYFRLPFEAASSQCDACLSRRQVCRSAS